MIDAKKIEQIAEQITNAIPPGVKNIADNVEDKIILEKCIMIKQIINIW